MYDVKQREMNKFANAKLDATCLALGLKEDIKDIINMNYRAFVGKSAAQLRAKLQLNVYEESSSLREELTLKHPELMSAMANAEMQLAEILWLNDVRSRDEALVLAEAVFNRCAKTYHELMELTSTFKYKAVAAMRAQARPARTVYPKRIKDLFW